MARTIRNIGLTTRRAQRFLVNGVKPHQIGGRRAREFPQGLYGETNGVHGGPCGDAWGEDQVRFLKRSYHRKMRRSERQQLMAAAD